MFEIKRALFPENLSDITDIYHEYVNSASVSLDFQNNDSEFTSLAEDYNHTGAGIYLAWLEDKVVGCSAYRKLDEHSCEMKRVYVRPEARSRGLGAKLVEKVLTEARVSAYDKIYLDVLPEFDVALEIYLAMGFKPDKAISHNPIPGTKFLSLDLRLST